MHQTAAWDNVARARLRTHVGTSYTYRPLYEGLNMVAALRNARPKDVPFMPQPLFGAAEGSGQGGQVRATEIAQLDAREVVPDAYGLLGTTTFPLLFRIYKPQTRLKPGDVYKTKPQLAIDSVFCNAAGAVWWALSWLAARLQGRRRPSSTDLKRPRRAPPRHGPSPL
jgi:hypothetical protein